MTNQRLKYLGTSIVFQEIPNEVTLAINVSGCPHHCEDCHSEYLWKYIGHYISDDIDMLLDKYSGMITCVCFMGGDQNQDELERLLEKVINRQLKTALYSGCDSFDDIEPVAQAMLDYIKLGHYDAKLGPLNAQTTNQHMYEWNNHDMEWRDITYKFWKDKR